MIKESIFPYFHFGTVVRYLQDIRFGMLIWKKDYVADNIKVFFEYLEDLELSVTRRVAEEFYEYWMEQFPEEDENATLTVDQATKMTNYMTGIRKTLSAELEGFDAYILTPKRLDIDKLMKDVSSLFAPNVYESLPLIAKYDFSEAGKCIAFIRPTAAAFHLLRGTEAVLKHYYFDMIKTNRIKSLMWGNILEDLRKKRKTSSKTTLINNLDNIRLSFRNPTQHPEKTYDIEEVQDLWGLCVDVVNRMVNDLGA